MNVLTIDYETTTHENGNFHSNKNKAVCLGIKHNDLKTKCEFKLELIPKTYLVEPLVVAFNAKFELGWSRRLGLDMPKHVWCCQLAEYMLDRQKPYPSLEETAKKYGLSSKLDIVKTEYWDKGTDTTGVPQNILSDYCIQDVELTYAIYLIQLKQFQERPALYRLFKLACQDLLVLAEMEWNGLPFNETLCKERANECEKEKLQIVSVLSSVYPDVPINFGSGDQLSAFLYGGTVVQTVKQPVGVFKTGERKGQVKFQNVDIEHKLPRLVEPLKNSELKKPGFYATDEGTLKKLKGPFAKKYVTPILRLARLDKLIGTYYEGLPKLNKTMDWNASMLYPNYNQCVTQTGRLSSSRPNGQNLAGDIADVIVSVYD
jgi:DNA polymerase I-like protein with 3'-5' exonuclease and polymerase domains